MPDESLQKHSKEDVSDSESEDEDLDLESKIDIPEVLVDVTKLTPLSPEVISKQVHVFFCDQVSFLSLDTC